MLRALGLSQGQFWCVRAPDFTEEDYDGTSYDRGYAVWNPKL